MKNILYIQRSIIIIMLLLFSGILNAQSDPVLVPDEEKTDLYYSKAVAFMQGQGVLESWFVDEFMPLYDNFMKAEYGSYILFGQALAALGSLFYLGFIGWQMISGDKEWEVLPMLRPFAIGLLLMNWVSFVDLVKAPLVMLQVAAHEDFNESQEELNALRMTRYKMQHQVLDHILEAQARAKAEIEQTNVGSTSLFQDGLDLLSDGMTDLISPVYEMYARLQIDFQLVISSMLEMIGLWFLRACTYSIFFIQLLFSTVLIMIGPISVGLSMFPMFSSSFSTWLSRFINVNLYGFLAFIVLRLGSLLQRFAFEAEIDRYKEMVDGNGAIKNADLIITYSSGGLMTFGLVIICFVITGVGMLLVPTLANYIISTGSNSSIMSKAKQASSSMASSGKALIFRK